MKHGMKFGRREVMLAGLATGLAATMGFRTSHAKVLAAGGTVDQTAELQAALDKAAHSGTPLFLPPGTYKTGRLTLKSGTQLQGVSGRTVLIADAHTDGIFETFCADAVRLSGLVLDGGGAAPNETGALLTAAKTTNLDVSGCRFLNSGAHGVSLRKASDRIANCEFEAIAKTAVLSEDATGLEISHNIVDTVAVGISISGVNESGRLPVVQGNRIRNLFLRKIGACGGIGIGVEADCNVAGNIIENAPAYGILVSADDRPRSVSVTGNTIRESHIGIGVSANPYAGTAHIADNLIDGTKDGGIRAMSGPKPVGTDLARGSAGATGDLSVYANVSR